jgi:hypothetical protein
LIAESLVAITASSTSLGIHSSPALESVLVRELLVNFCWRGFLTCIPYSLPLEVGESSRGDVSIEAVGSSGAVFDATLCLQVVEISFDGNVKGFLDVMAQVVEGQRLEVQIFIPKFKGKRELQNLDCNISYDARSLGFTRSKSKRALAMM